uniref:Uncharacterized protein n=1 Tax=Noccaea caerulescens TaxID=107243 RepID=A0A1J3E8I2_NOCCA
MTQWLFKSCILKINRTYTEVSKAIGLYKNKKREEKYCQNWKIMYFSFWFLMEHNTTGSMSSSWFTPFLELPSSSR